MSSGKSEQTRVVTKTVRTMGPDGKMRTQTIKEETKVIRDGKGTTTTTTTQSQGGKNRSIDSFQSGKQPKTGFFSSLLKNKPPARNYSTSSSGSTSIVPPSLLPSSRQSAESRSSGNVGGQTSVPLDQFRKEALQKHNEYRSKHGAKPLTMNDDLNKFAQEWAEKMAKSGQFMHRPNGIYGENIYYGMNSNGISADDVVGSWYNEVKNYNFSKQGFRSGTGHFTQVVWKESKELGIGRVEPEPGLVYVVTNYNPPGNVQGNFDANVSPAK